MLACARLGSLWRKWGRLTEAADLLHVIKAELRKVTPVAVPGLPRLVGGAVGYLGYDVVRFFETLPGTAQRDLDALGFLGGTIVIGLTILAPLYVWEALNSEPVTFSAGVIAGVAYTGIFPSVLAYLFWNRGVAEVGANRAGQFLHLIPVFGTLLAVIFLGESLKLFHLSGAALIFVGIYLAAPRAA